MLNCININLLLNTDMCGKIDQATICARSILLSSIDECRSRSPRRNLNQLNSTLKTTITLTNENTWPTALTSILLSYLWYTRSKDRTHRVHYTSQFIKTFQREKESNSHCVYSAIMIKVEQTTHWFNITTWMIDIKNHKNVYHFKRDRRVIGCGS